MGSFPFVPPASGGPAGATPAALGLTALTTEPYACSATQVITGQSVYWVLVTAVQTATVTTMGTWVQTAGVTAGTGVNEMAVYSAAGTLLQATGDASAAFGSTGIREAALSASLALIAGTSYYLALTANFTGTALVIYCQASSVAIPSINSNFVSLSDSGHATMPASFTPSGVSLNKSALFLYAR